MLNGDCFRRHSAGGASVPASRQPTHSFKFLSRLPPPFRFLPRRSRAQAGPVSSFRFPLFVSPFLLVLDFQFPLVPSRLRCSIPVSFPPFFLPGGASVPASRQPAHSFTRFVSFAPGSIQVSGLRFLFRSLCSFVPSAFCLPLSTFCFLLSAFRFPLFVSPFLLVLVLVLDFQFRLRAFVVQFAFQCLVGSSLPPGRLRRFIRFTAGGWIIILPNSFNYGSEDKDD